MENQNPLNDSVGVGDAGADSPADTVPEESEKQGRLARSFRYQCVKNVFRRSVSDPFTRMSRTQIFSTAGDALFSVSLAGTIFFAQEPTEARWRVALYLALTVAPFIIAAPFIGPLLDKVAGGRKWTLFAAAAARAFLAFMVMRDINSLWFYPEVFLFLVFGRVHMISKSAVIPSTVPSGVQLVTANSMLSFLATVTATTFGGVGLLMGLLSPQVALGVAALMFGCAAFNASKLPNVAVAPEPPTDAETLEVNSEPIKAAAQALTVIRGLLGFFIFFAAFNFKNNEHPLWWLGVVAVSAQVGYFIGIVTTPWLRKKLHEQQTILTGIGVMTAMSVCAVLLLAADTVGEATTLVVISGFALALGVVSSGAKLSFDALVQMDAPDGNRGRMFAAFETRFQIVWAMGALLAVLIPFSDIVAMVFVVLLSATAFVSYAFSRHNIKISLDRKQDVGGVKVSKSVDG